MEEVLEKLEFPYVNKKPSSHLAELFDNHRSQLKEELTILLRLRLPSGVAHADVHPRLRFIGWKPIPLLIQILLKSLIMRFNFHFYGQQKTNDRRKVNPDFTCQLAPVFLISSRSGTSIRSSVGFSITNIFSPNIYNHYSMNCRMFLRSTRK